MEENWVQFLDQEDPLEEEMAPFSSILAWKIPFSGQRSLVGYSPKCRKESDMIEWLSSHTDNLPTYLTVFSFVLPVYKYLSDEGLNKACSYDATYLQFHSVAQLCPTLQPHGLQHTRSPLPVHHQLPEPTQTHVHCVDDAIQPSHPLLSPSPHAFNLSQHQALFKWVSSLHQVAKVLEFQLQHQSFQWTPRTDLLQDGLVGSPCSPRESQESSPTPQFKSNNSFVGLPNCLMYFD